MRRTDGRGTKIVLGAAGGLLVLFGLAQLLLPTLAARRIRSDLSPYGVVRSASVSAFPAVELLWGKAQSMSVSTGPLNIDPAEVGSLLWQARSVQRIDMHAESMRVGALALSDVSWQKRGGSLSLTGVIGEAQLREALPGSSSFRLLGSGPGGVEMQVGGSLFGLSASIDVQLTATDGRLVAAPRGPIGRLVEVTLLSAPHLYVRSVALADAPAVGADPTYRVSIAAQLR
jgi:hypothetical protein